MEHSPRLSSAILTEALAGALEEAGHPKPGPSQEPWKPSVSAHMDTRTAQRIVFCLTEHFPRHGRRVAFAERKKPQQVGDRISFRPSEIHVRQLARSVAD